MEAALLGLELFDDIADREEVGGVCGGKLGQGHRKAGAWWGELHFLWCSSSSAPLEGSRLDPRCCFNRFWGWISSSLLDRATALAVRFDHDPMIVGSMVLATFGLVVGRLAQAVWYEIAAL